MNTPGTGRIAAFIAAACLCGHVTVRTTHAKLEFDKTAEETSRYTFFDAWSRTDTLLDWAFDPLLTLDSAVLGRPFEKDKG